MKVVVREVFPRQVDSGAVSYHSATLRRRGRSCPQCVPSCPSRSSGPGSEGGRPARQGRRSRRCVSVCWALELGSPRTQGGPAPPGPRAWPPRLLQPSVAGSFPIQEPKEAALESTLAKTTKRPPRAPVAASREPPSLRRSPRGSPLGALGPRGFCPPAAP